MEIQLINKSGNPLPDYETALSSGMDLRACLSDPVTINPMQRVLVPTGIFLALPPGVEGQIRPRSGLALKLGITVLNAPGTIDADYRGEVKVLLINLSDTPVVISHGDRIAQMVIARHERAVLISEVELNTTPRGEGGFGSTGNK